MNQNNSQNPSGNDAKISASTKPQAGSQYDSDHWQKQFSKEPYFESGRKFEDYEPAYKLGADARQKHDGKRFEQAEPEIKQQWESLKTNAHIGWEKAKLAARASWDRAERAMPGDADKDGR